MMTDKKSVIQFFYTFFCHGSCHKRQKPQAPTPQAPIRNRQTRKVANAKGLNRNTNLTYTNFGVCDFSRLAVTDWRLRRWR